MIHLLEFWLGLIRNNYSNVFTHWIEAISRITFGEIVAIDGKTLRHSYDKSKNQSAIHMEACLGYK